MMEDIQTKGTFEFTLYNVSSLTKPIYSPPFATCSLIFWQLKFIPSNPEYPDFCSVYLRSIFNTQEIHSTQSGTRQTVLPATIYLRDLNPQTAQTHNARGTSGGSGNSGSSGAYIIKSTVHNDTFSFYHRNRGFSRFYKRSMLPDTVVLGIDFASTEFKVVPFMERLPGKTFPSDLSEAWEQQLNKCETVDVQFNVQGQIIYASSAILARRSAYFEKILQERWSECNGSGGLMSSTCNHIKYSIDVPDFHPETFLEMLRFLYTDKVTLNKNEETHRTPMELFAIADKYLIAELRQRAMAVMTRDLNDNNAAELLLSSAWKYPDLKEDVMKYVVANFSKVRKSPAYRAILQNTTKFPRSSEILYELIQALVPEDEPTGKDSGEDAMMEDV